MQAKKLNGKYVFFRMVNAPSMLLIDNEDTTLYAKDILLEKKEDIIKRIHEASHYVPLKQLCLSTQCGFSSTEEGNKITEADQWKKIRLVKEIAQEVWG